MNDIGAMRYVPIFFLLLIILIAFFPSLSGGFIYDDFRFITHNPYMKGPFDPWGIFFETGSMERNPIQDIYRPLRTLFFYIEQKIGGGDARFHHVLSLLLHGANACLVFIFIQRILQSYRKEKFLILAPWMGASLFALHPVQVETVAWISSRGDQTALFFVLLNLILALRAKGGRSWVYQAPLSFLLTFLACLSKESGMVTGPLILLVSICFQEFRNRNTILQAVFSLAATFGFLILRGHVLGGLESQVPPHGGNFWTNICCALFGQGYQTTLVFRPWFNNIDYDRFFDFYPFPGIAVVGFLYLGLMLASLWTIRRNPYVSFAVLFFGLSQFPTSSLLIALRSLVNDRYLHLPMVAVGLLASLILDYFIRGSKKAAFITLGLSFILWPVLGGFTFFRCQDLKSEESLWTSTLRINPGSIKARIGLSTVFFNQGDPEKALAMAEEALGLTSLGSSIRTDALYCAAKALNQIGKEEEAAEYLRQALREAETAGSLPVPNTRLSEVCKNLWSFEMKAGRSKTALYAAEKLLEYEGETPISLLLMGQTLQRLGEMDRAEEVLKKGASLGQDCPEIHFALFELFMHTGRTQAAKQEYEIAVEIQKKLKRQSP